jgi:hypothetical protein
VSAGKYVAAHCCSDRGIQLCCRAGVRTIGHGDLALIIQGGKVHKNLLGLGR